MPTIIYYIARKPVRDEISLETAQQDASNGTYYIMVEPNNATLDPAATLTCLANDDQATYAWEVSQDGETWASAGITTSTAEVSTAGQYRCTATMRDASTDTSTIAIVEGGNNA